MALILNHQTPAEFAERFWNKLLSAQRFDKFVFSKLCYWLIERINAGDITDNQARNSFNNVFGRNLTIIQWTTFKTNRLIPAHDRYAAMINEADL